MVELLKLNPDYCAWGPHEDYMSDGSSWSKPSVNETWSEFGPWSLDDLNEVVNFYFELNRDSVDCVICNGSGYTPDAQWITESFYSHSSPFTLPTSREVESRAVLEGFGCQFKENVHGRGGFPDERTLAKYGDKFRAFCDEMLIHGSWADRLTDDEWDALIEQKRVKRRGETGHMGHDAINRWILIEARCKRLGVPLTCDACDGHGSQFTEPEGHISLILWFLHPRKGCSRGVEIKRITQDDLPAVFDFLRTAANRNAERFAMIPEKSGPTASRPKRAKR